MMILIKRCQKKTAQAVKQGVASKFAADKTKEAQLALAIKAQKAATAEARKEATAAVNRAEEAKKAMHQTSSKATIAINTAKDAAASAKQALKKLYAIANNKKERHDDKDSNKTTAPNLQTAAKEWGAMEKKAAENAMKAIAANIKAVRAEI